MATVSALLGSKMAILPSISSLSSTTTTTNKPLPPLHFAGTPSFRTIECSSRPQKKATAHHRKTRPRKSAAWDIRRGPCVYPPLPPLPADWSFAAVDDGAAVTAAAGVETLVAPLET